MFNLFNKFNENEILTNIMIYWITNTAGNKYYYYLLSDNILYICELIGSSIQFYYEFMHGANPSINQLLELQGEV